MNKTIEKELLRISARFLKEMDIKYSTLYEMNNFILYMLLIRDYRYLIDVFAHKMSIIENKSLPMFFYGSKVEMSRKALTLLIVHHSIIFLKKENLYDVFIGYIHENYRLKNVNESILTDLMIDIGWNIMIDLIDITKTKEKETFWLKVKSNLINYLFNNN